MEEIGDFAAVVDTTAATNEIQWRRVMAAGNNKHRRGDSFFLSKMRVAESGFQREAGEGGTKRGEEFSCLLYGIDPFGRLPTYQNGAGIKLSIGPCSPERLISDFN